MTQKELLYYEDAIGHEENIMQIIHHIMDNLEDDELITFMQEEEKKHQDLKQKLMDVLREAANE